MACLIANLPSMEVWVRKEYLTDHQSGHGEFVKRTYDKLLSKEFVQFLKVFNSKTD